jgi:hypothetical protein
MKYKIVNSSDNTEIGTILPHGQVSPVLKVVDGKYFDFEGREFIMMPDKKESVPESEGGSLGIVAIGALVAIIAVVFLLSKKK